MEKITHEEGNEGAWVCICGNMQHEDGFYPCNEKGVQIEPDEESGWDGVLYVCDNDKCRRIIDQNTLEVVDKAKK